jgi:hypothetical protein
LEAKPKEKSLEQCATTQTDGRLRIGNNATHAKQTGNNAQQEKNQSGNTIRRVNKGSIGKFTIAEVWFGFFGGESISWILGCTFTRKHGWMEVIP